MNTSGTHLLPRLDFSSTGRIAVGKVGGSSENITQRLQLCGAKAKPEALLKLLEEVPGDTLVFVQKKRTAGWLMHFLQERGIQATAIHGDRTQAQRESALKYALN